MRKHSGRTSVDPDPAFLPYGKRVTSIEQFHNCRAFPLFAFLGVIGYDFEPLFAVIQYLLSLLFTYPLVKASSQHEDAVLIIKKIIRFRHNRYNSC